MTFYASAVVAQQEPGYKKTQHCFCCNQAVTEIGDGPVIGYDAYISDGVMERVLMHRDCAFAMAQRIICDAWPNRRAGEVRMQNDR